MAQRKGIRKTFSYMAKGPSGKSFRVKINIPKGFKGKLSRKVKF